MKGIIFDQKELGIHDGPGIRTTLFLKGCPLRCLWCHNPEGLSPSPQLMISKNGCTDCKRCKIPCNHPQCRGFERCTKICPNGLIRIAGVATEAGELAEKLKRQSLFFHGSGVTISGGEPTMQPEFLLELIGKLEGIPVIVETCGHTREEVFRELIHTDSLLYFDLKHMDSAVHKRLTGVDNELIQSNLSLLMESGNPFVIRVPLIPGCNDDAGNLRAVAERLSGCRNLIRAEFLPYNPFAAAKYSMAGLEYPLNSREMGAQKPAEGREAEEVQKAVETQQIPEALLNSYGINYRIL